MHAFLPASFFIFTLIALIASCNSSDKKKTEEVYASLSDTVKYSGMNACRQCHADKYETFIHTGMGLSFDKASKSKSSAAFPTHAPIFDKYKNLFYYPHWENDSLFVTEFRLEKKDTIFKRKEKISWIVGSGQHTNSHLMNVNGYVYQAPATFYTQKQQWDLPPGFEGGFNTRFSRAIGLECMTCHNAYPEIVNGSDNKYNFVANGIDCERCHGPGSAHIAQKLSGKIIDTKNAIDYSILNPAKLPINLQLDICQRCHIQGNAVLKKGKSFLDFRPGMNLSDVMDVYMPVFSVDEEAHIMASHAERLKLSQCFLQSAKIAEEQNKIHPSLTPYKNAMTCVTCHDPHVSVRSTDKSVFNSKCIACHSRGTTVHESPEIKAGVYCSEEKSKRMAVGDNCVSCHMPKNGTIDIPHVTTTDHFIRKPVEKSDVKKVKEFLGLACINNSNPDSISTGNAFISYYEKFSSNPSYLDSALKYFKSDNKEDINKNFNELIRLYYLKNDFGKVIEYANAIPDKLNSFKSSVMNDDAWTAYRIGEAFNAKSDALNTLKYYRKATELAQYQLDFRNKLAGAELDNGLTEEAISNYRFILKENPEYASAYVSLGYALLLQNRDHATADSLYDKALSLDPDNIQAFMNKAAIRLMLGENLQAKKFLQEVLKRDKSNVLALRILKQIK